MLKPLSQACLNNREPILQALSPLLASRHRLLEIGSGTGQHAVYFGEAMPHLLWQTSDVLDNHEGIQQWLDEAALENVLPPLVLDVNRAGEDESRYEAIFTANTFHIMAWQTVESCIALCEQKLEPGGLLIVYGPFNYQGGFTSDSNQRFHQWLRAADPGQGIRDFEQVDAMMRRHHLELHSDQAMPANNRLICWQLQK